MILQLNRIFWKLIYSVGNLQLAIVLLLLISVFSSLGTIIEQEKSTDFYELIIQLPLQYLVLLAQNSSYLLG